MFYFNFNIELNKTIDNFIRIIIESSKIEQSFKYTYTELSKCVLHRYIIYTLIYVILVYIYVLGIGMHSDAVGWIYSWT